MIEKLVGWQKDLEERYGMLTGPAKRILLALIRLGISFIILILMLLHLAKLVSVDVYVIVLGLAMFLLWFGDNLLKRFNRVEGFGIRLDIREIEQLEQKVPGTRFAESETPEQTVESSRQEDEFEQDDDELPAFLQITGSDVGLGLAGLRIELERELIRLTGDDRRGTVQFGGVSRLTRHLVSRGVLTELEGSVILDLTVILNAAVHAHPVDDMAAERALNVGIDILHTLRNIRVRESRESP